MDRMLLNMMVTRHATRGLREDILFSRVRESLSQKLIVPSDPVVIQCSKGEGTGESANGKSYHKWRMYRVWDGN
jgi:hypothetical protein